MGRYCYIRKNHMTINAETEIFEIVDYDNGHMVHAYGTVEDIDTLLGTAEWDMDTTVVVDQAGYQIVLAGE